MPTATLIVVVDAETRSPVDPEHGRCYGAECPCGWSCGGLPRRAAIARRDTHRCPTAPPDVA